LFTDELAWTFQYLCQRSSAGVRWPTSRRPMLRELREVVGGLAPQGALRDLGDVVAGLHEHRDGKQELLVRLLALLECGHENCVPRREPREVQQLDEDRRVDDADRHLPACRNSSSVAWA